MSRRCRPPPLRQGPDPIPASGWCAFPKRQDVGHTYSVRLRLSLFVAVLVILIGGTRSSATTCVAQTEEQARRAADVVFEGVAGDVALQPLPGHEGVVEQIARFRVEGYRKGRGPTEVRVRAGRTSGPGSVEGIAFGGVEPKPGERWVIYGDLQPDAFVLTSYCAGSHLASQPGIFATGPGARLADHVRYRWLWFVAVPLVLAGIVVLTRRRLRSSTRDSLASQV
jgi:hypothetical protein